MTERAAVIASDDAALGLDKHFCFALYSTALALGKTYAPLLAELGLTYPQYLVMLVLWSQDGLSTKSIGERLFLDSGTLTPVLKRLQSAGFVQRSRDPRDDRVVRTHLTEAGAALRTRAVDVPCRITAAMGRLPGDLTALQAELEQIRLALMTPEGDPASQV